MADQELIAIYLMPGVLLLMLDVLFLVYAYVVITAFWEVTRKVKENEIPNMRAVDKVELNFLITKFSVGGTTLITLYRALILALIPLSIVTYLFTFSVYTGIPMEELFRGFISSMIS